MNAVRPGAEPEYSRGDTASEEDFAPPAGHRPARSRRLETALVVVGLAGAILLVAAELSPLLTVHTSVSRSAPISVSTSTHDSWALIPLALLAVLLSVSAWQTGSRLARLGIGVTGIVVALIALLGDLPDAQASGVIDRASVPYAIAASTPAAGFYLETLGALLLIIAGGASLMLSAPPRRNVGGA